MDELDYKRAVRTLAELSSSDRAIVVARMLENGQVVILNCGNTQAREEIYLRLRMTYVLKEHRKGVVI